MKTAIVLLVLFLTVATDRTASAGQTVSQREKSVPGSLCVPATSQRDFEERFDEATRRRWNNSYTVYRRWLKHVEVLEFLASSEENQTFLASARNVTPDDEVFLRVRRANPLVYSYTVKVERTDTAEQDLLTITGTPIAEINPFAVKEAGEAVEKATKAAGTTPEATGAEKATSALADLATKNRLSVMLEAKAITKGNVRPALTDAEKHFSNALMSLETARREQTKYFADIRALQADVSRHNAGAQSVADRAAALQHADCFEQGDRCLTEKIRSVLGEPRSPNTLASLVAAHDVLATRIASLAVSPGALEGALEQAEESLQHGKDALRRAGMPEAEIPKYPDVSILTVDIALVRKKTEEMIGRVERVRASMATLRTELQALQESLSLALTRAQDADVCLGLGRFPGQTTVDLTIEVTKRAPPEVPKAPNIERLTELARNLLAAAEQISKTAAAGAGPDLDKKAGPEKQATEKPDPEKPDPEKSKPSVAHSATTRFQVLRAVHVQTTLGYAVSSLANPSFDFKSRTIEEVKDAAGAVITPAMKEITPFALDQNERQLLPMVQFGLHVKPRYPFAEPDASPSESIRPWHRWIPFPTVGFALSSPTDNYFLGGGINLSRGVVAISGVHFGKVKRLVAHRQADVPFQLLATDDFDIDDIIDEGIRRRFFFAVAIDSAAIGRLFSAVGGGEEESGSKKK